MAEPLKMCLIQTRELDIRDVMFAVRSRQSSYTALDLFRKANLVYFLKPEWEWPLVQFLVRSHPTNSKDFEHFLVSPPPMVTPSDIVRELKERSRMIPTLFVVRFLAGEPFEIEQVRDYYHLISLVFDAKEDNLVDGDAGCRF